MSLVGAERLETVRVSQAELQYGENMRGVLLRGGCRAIKCIQLLSCPCEVGVGFA